MELKITDIETDLNPPREHDREIKAALLAEMFLTFPSQGQTQTETVIKTKTRIYAEVLDAVPAWAMRIALRKWYAGKVEGVAEASFTWAPSPAVLLRAAEDEMKPYRDAVEDMKLLLDVKPLDATIQELQTSERVSPLRAP